MCALFTFLICRTETWRSSLEERACVDSSSVWRIQTILGFRRVSLLFFSICLVRMLFLRREWVFITHYYCIGRSVWLCSHTVCSQGQDTHVLNCTGLLVASSLNQYEVTFFMNRGPEHVHVCWCTCVCRYVCVHMCIHMEARSQAQVSLFSSCPPCVLRQDLSLGPGAL